MFRVLGRGQVPVLLLCWFGFMGGAVPEAEAVVSGFKDVAMMGQAIEQGGGHFGIAKDTAPLGEGQIGRDDHAGALVKLGQQVEQQRSS